MDLPPKKTHNKRSKKIVHEEPETASELAILTFNDDGSPVGKAVLGTSFLPLRQAA